MARTFGGVTINLPGVYTSNDVSAFTAPSVGGTVNVGIIGPAKGGLINKIYKFNSYREASEVLKGGELLDLIRLLYNPGGSNGAGTVFAVRIAGSGATQASKEFGSLKVKAIDYGTLGNFIKVGVADGTSVGKKVTIYDTLSNEVETFDNMGPVFSIRYTGGGASCTLSISVVNGNATTLSLSALDSSNDPIPADSLTLDLTSTDYNTVGKVLNAISLTGKYQVTVSTYFSDTSLPSSYLDAVSSQDVKTNAYTVTATLGICINTINKNSKFITAEKSNASATNPPTNGTLDFLSGGNDGGTPTTQDYGNALNLFTNRDIQIVCVASGDTSVHNLVVAHVNDCSSVTGKRERMAFLGLGNPSASKSDYIAAAVPYSNNYRVVLCAPGIVENVGGTLVQRPSYYTAALLAGLKAGLQLKENITYKNVGVWGLTQEFSMRDLADLMNSGVTVLEYDENDTYRVVKGVTTYRADENLAKKEISAILIIDAISKDIRRMLERKYLGAALTSTIANTITYDVGSVLSEYVSNGALIGNPPYRNIVVNVRNEAIYISFEASPATVANYIFVAQTFVPAYSW